MQKYPRAIEGSNIGDGSPLVLGDETLVSNMHAPCDPTSTIHVLDWDCDGEMEMLSTGNDMYSHKFINFLDDGTPVVDRGVRLGEMSRAPHRDEKDEGLTGCILVAADFDNDGNIEVILKPRYYSKSPHIAMKLSKEHDKYESNHPEVIFHDTDGEIEKTDRGKFEKGTVAAADWDSDGKIDLIILDTENEQYSLNEKFQKIVPEDQRLRYSKEGKWPVTFPAKILTLYKNISKGSSIAFQHHKNSSAKVPKHTKWISLVNPKSIESGLLLATYYGRVYYMPINLNGTDIDFGAYSELFTIQDQPFNSANNIDINIGVADPFESNRFDIFAGDRSQNPIWCKYLGKDGSGKPVYDTPKKIKQHNPHVSNSFFSVPTVGDWRNTGMPDLLVGGVEGYILWYKTISINPLRFSKPEKLRYGTTEIRRLATPNPSAGYTWGGSQSPYDGDTGGYSNPVLVDWDGNGLLDIIVSDMIGLYDYYPNWGNKEEPELGPPQRLTIIGGEPLRGPWRQKPGIGDFTGTGKPDIVIQDLDLDLAIFRRPENGEPNIVLPGEKLLYEDGKTIKTHGVYTPGGGDGRGRTKINVVDWDGDGLLDLLIGVGPQHGSPFRGSYVLFLKNVGTNNSPVFKHPQVVLWNKQGKPLEFWRHGVHPEPVDWNGDGKYDLVAGSDQGRVWFWNREHFGEAADGSYDAVFRPDGEYGLGDDRGK